MWTRCSSRSFSGHGRCALVAPWCPQPSESSAIRRSDGQTAFCPLPRTARAGALLQSQSLRHLSSALLHKAALAISGADLAPPIPTVSSGHGRTQPLGPTGSGHRVSPALANARCPGALLFTACSSLPACGRSGLVTKVTAFPLDPRRPLLLSRFESILPGVSYASLYQPRSLRAHFRPAHSFKARTQGPGPSLGSGQVSL